MYVPSQIKVVIVNSGTVFGGCLNLALLPNDHNDTHNGMLQSVSITQL